MPRPARTRTHALSLPARGGGEFFCPTPWVLARLPAVSEASVASGCEVEIRLFSQAVSVGDGCLGRLGRRLLTWHFSAFLE